MNKITQAVIENAEMTAIGIARVEMKKVSDPMVRAGLETIVDLLEHLTVHGLGAPHQPADVPDTSPLSEGERTG